MATSGIAYLKTHPVQDFQQYCHDRIVRKEKLTLQATCRRLLIEGEIWDRGIWLRNGKTCTKFGKFLVFRIMNVFVRIECATQERWKPDTMRVHLDLVPEGQTHPNSIIKRQMSPPRYKDPAKRLGIKVSGILAGDCWETREPKDSPYYKSEVLGIFWAAQDGGSNAWVARWNKLVDWLECKDESVVRPRRFYPREMLKPSDQYYGYRANDLYTLHPLNAPDWMRLHTIQEHCAFNDDGKRKAAPTHPLPITALLTEWRDHWPQENPPKTEEEKKEEERLAKIALEKKKQEEEEDSEKSEDSEEEELEENSAEYGESLLLDQSDGDEMYDCMGEEPEVWPYEAIIVIFSLWFWERR